ncbi:unnamed protein product [Clonostachys rosea]|uniref:Prion-inhibition and propagation HeLo domain-containing protein n=1 Tax=Bionectria ochroleuca TaxID=29856 RepID=A0ABY6UE08_BIOOC|nr:unnamed protein product [Clonostachys rosea]
MATGLEILGAVAASLEIFKVAKSCLSLFHDVHHINLQHRQHRDAHLILVVQGLRFERWCSSLGILDLIQSQESNPEPRKTDEEIKKLAERLAIDINLRNAAFQQLALNALRSLMERFQEATAILQRYYQDENYVQGPLIPQQTRWVSGDKNALFELLGEIEKTNDLLLELLPSVLRVQVSRRAELTILNEPLKDSLNLPKGSDLKALASLKNWQLVHSDEADHQETVLPNSISTTHPKPSKASYRGYNIQDFKKGTLRHGEHRSLSVLNDRNVMVEWKYYSKAHTMRVEQVARLGDLADLLNTNELHKRFSTFPCGGLVHDIDNSRIGIIFRITNMDQEQMLLRDLQTVIAELDTAPPMGQRFALARTLATAVHHLHSVHWFHKSIRSDNIVAVLPVGKLLNPGNTFKKGLSELGDKAKALQAREISQPGDPLPTFFLVGWDLSRPDHPSELSETLSVSTAGFKSRRNAIEMYSYPGTNSKQKSGKRSRYRAEYDFYSLGIILLEIGLWRSVSTIRASCSDDSTFRVRLRSDYCDRLLSRMGVIYWRVVQRCINNDFLPHETNDPDDSYALQAAFEKHVVSELEKCSA